MRIAGRDISAGNEPYVIAEIGVNHDGSVSRALELVDAAAIAGADAVKFQLFDAGLLMSRDARLAAYQRASGERDPVEMLRRLELGWERMLPVVARARERGVHAIVSVFSVELVPEAERAGFDAYKTASPDLIHRPLLMALAETGRPLIVSTGTATLDEVRRAAEWLGAARERVAFLQCVSSYPTAPSSAALGGIRAIAGVWNGPVGYSDHTTLVETGALAVAAGACILEKHLTYSRRAPGPDHAASLEPDQFAEYVRRAREARRMIGVPEKTVQDSERDVRQVSRQSVVARRALRPGDVLTRADVTFKRPGTGIEPFRVDEIIGRRVRHAVECDAVIRATDLDR